MTEEAVYSVNPSATARDIWSRTQGDNWDLDDTPRGSLFDQAAIAVWKDSVPYCFGVKWWLRRHISARRDDNSSFVYPLYMTSECSKHTLGAFST